MLLKKIENIGDQLKGYTEKLVFSFADIHTYRRVKNNLEKEKIPYKEWSSIDMREFASKLLELNKKWKYELATCAEDPRIELKDFGIKPNHCIDDALMIRFAYEDKMLMDALNVDIKPMLGQIVQFKWMTPDDSCMSLKFHQLDSVFNILLHFSSKCLIERDAVPLCRYKNLLMTPATAKSWDK